MQFIKSLLLIVLSILGYLYLQSQLSKPKSYTYFPLVTEKEFLEIDSITFESQTEKIFLKKTDQTWQVQEPETGPADAAKVLQALDLLMAVKMIRIVSDQASAWPDYGLDKNHSITLRRGDQMLRKVILGDIPKQGGHYIGFEGIGDGDLIFLIDQSLVVKMSPSAWLLSAKPSN
ncbi:DUF4340 domain-containing protein [Pseudobacteriovorax antillogorgiicola]|uniref:DUF4340 domain-containing protein n=1 Tax=Pseudobacteriovorax antillogorgiicola TaxID=1513793 RepID=A0A1Y6CPX8_9BACT|nr:DUF4340 domain-containing protein [Pseudobacteriovorax antillogorgiicola]TCS46356.1 uncharacterized protein DUF4340 [Pseudobacteriovorax antillogorgiicola]SMF68207.1 protein of unknown function [Pseudobacteriovorax antillogorgiicola]